MCQICDGWQNGDSRGADPGTATPDPRLSSPSTGTGAAHKPRPYVFLASHWANRPGRTFTWSNATLRLNQYQGNLQQRLSDAQMGVMRQAFAIWAAVANVSFREVSDSDASDFRVGLSAIDGARNILGRAGSFTQGGFRVRSNIIFDTADYPQSGSVSLWVALHEIGHVLGLGHSPNTSSIMYAYERPRTSLHADDIAGVRALYGPSRTPLPTWPANETHNLGNLTSLTGFRTQSGSVNRPSDEIDHFRFTLSDTRTIGFELRSLSGNANLTLNDASGRYIAGSFNSGNSVDTFVRALDAGTYYVTVHADGSMRGTSNYRLRFGVPMEPAGGTRETAINLGNLTGAIAIRSRQGSVNWTGTLEQARNLEDFYRFTLTETRTMRFELRNLSANADLRLEDANGRWLGGSSLSGTSVDAVVRTLAAGTYYIRVDARDYSSAVRYQLAYRVQTTPDGWTRETAWNLGNMSNVRTTRIRRDTLDGSNNADFFRFTLTDTRTMRFELRNLSANADLRLEGADGRWLGSSSQSGTSVDAIVRTLAAGTYYIRVDAREYGAAIRYQLRYRVQSTPDGWTRETAWNLGNVSNVRTTRIRRDTLDGSNSADHYRFTLTGTRTMRFELRNLSANADLRLEDANGAWLGSSSQSGTSVDAIVRTLAAGTYYIRVDAREYGTGIRYQLRYRVQSTPDGWTRETAWNLGNASNVRTTRIRHGAVGGSNSTDFFRFTLTGTRTMRFELRNLSANADLRLEDANGAWLGSSSQSGTSVDAIVRTLAAGAYYIRVDAREYGTGIRYQLRYRVQSTPDGWTRETAWNLGNVTTVRTTRIRHGAVGGSNSTDFFRFTLTGTRTMRFELRNLSANADLRLENAHGHWFAGSSLSGTSADAIVHTLSAGTYYIRVDTGESATIRYALRYRVQSTPDGWTRETAWNLGNVTNVRTTRMRQGTVDGSNSTDYFRVTLTGTRAMRFELRNLSANADLRLEDANGYWLAGSSLSGTSVDSIVHTLSAGTYYIRVDARGSDTIRYQLRFGPPAETTSLVATPTEHQVGSLRPHWPDDVAAAGRFPSLEQRPHFGGILSA